MALALFSCPSDALEKITNALKEQHLVSFINAIPKVRKTYFLNGRICVKDEVLLLIQTPQENFSELFDLLIELHPSETPQINFFSQYDEYMIESLDSLR